MAFTTSRRQLLTAAVAAGVLGPAFLRDALAATAVAGEGPYGPLLPPDANGVMLPEGFRSRLIARGGEPVGGYPWHFSSDGQATYRTLDGGYVLVSNAENPIMTGGGSSAIKFSASGDIQRAYRILSSNMNCGGGPTPWGTWLSGEEHAGGMIWEADPAGILPAMPRPALGNFPHEAAAVDPRTGFVYLTEDEGDGCFYRFRPQAYGDLSAGVLEVAQVLADRSRVVWHEVPDPNTFRPGSETRNQVPQATRFDGGEGIWHDEGVIYFTTKGDKRVWAYDVKKSRIEIIFDRALAPDASLNAVDNVTVSAFGDVYVCEDGGNMEIGIITPDRVVSPFVRLPGEEHAGSEMCGVIFDPSGTRMYFSSQRAFPFTNVPGTPLPATVVARGAVYEVTGPFRLPKKGVPQSKVFGPPAGERLELPFGARGLPVTAPGRVSRRRLAARDLRFRVRLDEPATVRAILRTAEIERVKVERWAQARPKLTVLGRTSSKLGRGGHTMEIDVNPRRLPRGRASRAILTVEAVTASGRRTVAARVITVTNR